MARLFTRQSAVAPKTPKHLLLLVCANIVTIILPNLYVFWLVNTYKGSGAEYVVIMIAPLALVGYAVAFINLIYIPVVLFRYRPRVRYWVFGVIVGLLSLVYVGMAAMQTYQNYQDGHTLSKEEAVALINECQVGEISRNDLREVLITPTEQAKSQPNWKYYYRGVAKEAFDTLQQTAKEKAQDCKVEIDDSLNPPKPVAITVERAIDLLKTCKLVGFYYTNQTKPATNAEAASTGVILAFEEKPIRIHIADRLIPILVSVARESQKTCKDLQFWHDGRYEQRGDDGVWYLPSLP